MFSAALAGVLGLSLASLGASHSLKPDGYLAEPESGKGHGVLVLHAWWGLSSDVRAFCDRLAGSGFVAFAPDMFHGKTASTPEEAEALVKAHQSKDKEITAQIGEAAKFLAEKTGRQRIAVVGFSFGAYYALQYSNDDPERVRSVVVYYGTGHEDFAKSRASFLGHFAEKDDFEPKEAVDGLEKLLKGAGRSVTIHTYPGTGHWFVEPSVKTAYDQAAAELAWERTLAFLKRTN
jgi:carboxymethylenebutenolidase